METIKKVLIFFSLVILFVLIYSSSLIGVDDDVKNFLSELKIELKKENLSTNLFVISGRRWKLDNYILTKINGAASKSQHLKGKAIDIIILDINKDGKINSKDVDIVYQILDEKIVKDYGGIRRYKFGKINQQMIHFDSRGKKARWNR